MAQDLVKEVVVSLKCPACEAKLERAWVTTLSRCFTPQVKACRAEHVVAVAAGVVGRRLFFLCPNRVLETPVMGLNGPVGLAEVEAATLAGAAAKPRTLGGRR